MDKEEFYKKIEQTEKDNDKKDPCLHCGPGNGCDDCRGCSDSEVSHKLHLDLKKLIDEYKEKFGGDYDKEKKKKEFDRRFKYWTDEMKKFEQICHDCHGNVCDDCLYCNTLKEKMSCARTIKRCKEEYTKEFNEEYNMEKDKPKKRFYVEDYGGGEKQDSFIISAEEARKMVEKEIENDNACLKPIMELISKAIKRKDKYCYINEAPSYVIEKLRKLGYSVGDMISGNQREPDCRKISW